MRKVKLFALVLVCTLGIAKVSEAGELKESLQTSPMVVSTSGKASKMQLVKLGALYIAGMGATIFAANLKTLHSLGRVSLVSSLIAWLLVGVDAALNRNVKILNQITITQVASKRFWYNTDMKTASLYVAGLSPIGVLLVLLGKDKLWGTNTEGATGYRIFSLISAVSMIVHLRDLSQEYYQNRLSMASGGLFNGEISGLSVKKSNH
jgi:hypothetical protein